MTDGIVVYTDNKKMEESLREENVAGKKKIKFAQRFESNCSIPKMTLNFVSRVQQLLSKSSQYIPHACPHAI